MNERKAKDTSDFFAIDRGDVIEVGGRRYEVIGHAKERRFGIEDPKFWVKRVVDMETAERKIIKLAFNEAFTTTVAGVTIQCFRSPEKEARILAHVSGHPNFMQGLSYTDRNGSNIRVLDVVRGMDYLTYIDSFHMPHARYTSEVLPMILNKLIKAFEAIHFLHRQGFKHGDIRNDHLYMEQATGNLVWIDFDYDFETPENPFSLDLFGMGNLLVYTIGKGFHHHYMIAHDRLTYGNLMEKLTVEDFSILDSRRLMNLRKLYPHIHKTLNDVLMHFSRGADVYYEAASEIIEDLNRCLYSVSK